jgi:hypothetical protein
MPCECDFQLGMITSIMTCTKCGATKDMYSKEDWKKIHDLQERVYRDVGIWDVLWDKNRSSFVD